MTGSHRTRTSVALASALTLAALGCGGDSGGPDGGDGPDAAPADAAPPDAIRADAAPPGDCNNLPIEAPFTFLSHVPASEDFAFDDQGFLIGVSLDTGALTRTPYSGSPEILVPGVAGFARGTRILPGGDIVVANPGAGELLRFDSAGGSRTLLSGLPDPNGIAIDLNGFVYLTHGGGQIRRIDPDSGAFTVIHSASRSFDGITFSPDYQTLYFDEEEGTVHQMPIGPDGTPGPESILTTIPIQFLLDGMAADECGNIYVTEMAGMVWRVSPTGGMEIAADVRSAGPFIPAINFGSGIGGWKKNALYIMNFNGGVFEVQVDVRGKSEPHLP